MGVGPGRICLSLFLFSWFLLFLRYVYELILVLYEYIFWNAGCHPIGPGYAFREFESSAKDLRKRRLNQPHEARQALVLGSTGSCIMFAALVIIFVPDHVVASAFWLGIVRKFLMFLLYFR